MFSKENEPIVLSFVKRENGAKALQPDDKRNDSELVGSQSFLSDVMNVEQICHMIFSKTNNCAAFYQKRKLS